MEENKNIPRRMVLELMLDFYATNPALSTEQAKVYATTALMWAAKVGNDIPLMADMAKELREL